MNGVPETSANIGAADAGEDVVIVGACLAGMSTARQLRSLGFDGPIVLIGDEPHPPYDRPPLSKQFLTGGWGTEKLHLPGHAELADLGISLRLNSTAVSSDLTRRTVTLRDGTAVPFGQLVAATGVAPRPLPASGPAPHTMRTIDDARRVADELRPGRRAVVIGTGFQGTEMAWAAHSLGCAVSLVGIDPAPLPGLGAEIGGVISHALAEAGVTLFNSTSATEIRDGANGVREVLLDDGTVLLADSVIAAVGSVPRVEWLQGNGLDLSDGLRCDAQGRAAPGVFGVGDVARWWHAGLGRHLRVEHRMNAGEQARVVAHNVLGTEQDHAAPPFFWSDQGPNKLVVHGHVTPQAEFSLHSGSLAEGRFSGTYREGDHTVAVLSWNAPKDATRLRRELLV